MTYTAKDPHPPPPLCFLYLTETNSWRCEEGSRGEAGREEKVPLKTHAPLGGRMGKNVTEKEDQPGFSDWIWMELHTWDLRLHLWWNETLSGITSHCPVVTHHNTSPWVALFHTALSWHITTQAPDWHYVTLPCCDTSKHETLSGIMSHCPVVTHHNMRHWVALRHTAVSWHFTFRSACRYTSQRGNFRYFGQSQSIGIKYGFESSESPGAATLLGGGWH